MLNLDTKRETPVPKNFLKNLFKKELWFAATNRTCFKGIVLLPEGLCLFPHNLFLTSEGKGPVKGHSL